MSAGLDLCQGQGLVILSKSPEHRMLGGQADFLLRECSSMLWSLSLVESRCPVQSIILPHTLRFLTTKEIPLSVHEDLKIEVENLAEGLL